MKDAKHTLYSPSLTGGLRWVFSPIRECPFVFSISLMMSLGIMLICMMTGVAIGWFLCTLLPIFDCYLATVAAYLLRKVKGNYLILALVLLLNVSELFVIYFYHSTISIQVVQIVLETNAKESSEFIHAALNSHALWQTILSAVVIISLSIGIVKVLRKHALPKYVSYVLMLVVLWSGTRQASTYAKLTRCFASGSISECLRNKNMPHLSTPMVRLLYGVAFNVAASKELTVLQKTVEATKVDSCSFRCPLIVLVIGESYNKHHSSLYNKDCLRTTPRLEALQESGNLTVFTDAVSPFNLTSNVFKYMFSTWDDECEDDWTQHTLFPAVFKKAGYDVHFITNQFVINSDDFHNMAGGTIFNSAAFSEMQFTSRNDDAFTYDEELIGALPKMDEMKRKPTLLIMHLIGQHVEYADRYPERHAVFQPSDARTVFGGETGKQIMSDYDNATYYNDIVVDSLFQQFKEKDAICLYLSDHGEEAYDWRDSYDRTNESEVLKDVARYQYEIPFMIYMSDLFKLNHTDIVERVNAAKNLPFISTDICQPLFSLAGIKTVEYRAKHDILSADYNVKRKRIIRFDTDYDELMRRK